MIKAYIAELFEGIQGEGKSVGKPAIFIRFWGCNLRCRFNSTECDTSYAVIKEKKKAVEMTTEDVANYILEKNPYPNHLVWTGGEPLMFQEFILDVMQKLEGTHITSEVETNGTIPLLQSLNEYVSQFNLSVKLKSSNQMPKFEKLRINYNAINSFDSEKSYFKFVVSDEKDLKEVEDLQAMFPEMEIYLMPEGTRRKDIIKNSKKVMEWCLEYNYNFSPREHIIVYDNKRGV